jgi:hypothetical protein
MIACRLNVTDSQGTLAKTSEAVTLVNSAPVSSVPTLYPFPFSTEDSIECQYEVTDDNGDPTTSYIEWYVRENLTSVVNTRTLPAFSAKKGDSVYCRVTPYDGIENGTTVKSDTLVVSAAFPRVLGVHLSTMSPNRLTNISCLFDSIVNTDGLEGFTITHSYAWYLNGALAPVTSSLWRGGQVVQGDEIFCAIQVFNGINYSPQVQTPTATIVKVPPTVTVAITPKTDVVVNTKLNCSIASYASEDGLPATNYIFRWSVNALSNVVALSSALDLSTLNASTLRKNDRVSCQGAGTVDDVNYGALSPADDVVVLDSAPVVTKVLLSFDSRENPSLLNCSLNEFYDLDSGDVIVPINYTW